jgi:hypothetical protein
MDAMLSAKKPKRSVLCSSHRKSINIVSSDTDVVVIGVVVFDDLNVDHLWTTFGKGKDLRWIPIHDIVRSLGSRSKALHLLPPIACRNIRVSASSWVQGAIKSVSIALLLTTFSSLVTTSMMKF